MPVHQQHASQENRHNVFPDWSAGPTGLEQAHLHPAQHESQVVSNLFIDTVSGHVQPSQESNNPLAIDARPTRGRCGTSFKRPDSLKRHLDTSGSCDNSKQNKRRAGFICDLCEPGTKRFRRRDHLLQHLYVYHKISRNATAVTGRYKIRPAKESVGAGGSGDFNGEEDTVEDFDEDEE